MGCKCTKVDTKIDMQPCLLHSAPQCTVVCYHALGCMITLQRNGTTKKIWPSKFFFSSTQVYYKFLSFFITGFDKWIVSSTRWNQENSQWFVAHSEQANGPRQVQDTAANPTGQHKTENRWVWSYVMDVQCQKTHCISFKNFLKALWIITMYSWR